ncbi:helix-turn-helix domain-containing protein [Vagococcus fluvialis]|uniref:helix-turn-helix domain-containing protein n=1 Tax=Vagococcus fluvialis TaxID=2738 RepID=UPI001D0A86CD|nr:helix-turn-helix transcriptional regulator [Vagococcus fluvialis]UDM73293.1 helix-turn-helix transcriptional regulator [Vagococcus fluvialis]
MIRNNLATLFSERGLKATRVSAETGIARSTLSSLTQNDSKMIQLETINNLCMYLGITHQEFFSYIPYDLDYSLYLNSISIGKSPFNRDMLNVFNFDFYISVISKDGKKTYSAEGASDYEVDLIATPKLSVSYKINDDEFSSFWVNSIPTAFKTDILKQMNDYVSSEIKNQILSQLDDLGIEDLSRYNNIQNSLDFLTVESSTRLRNF